MERCCFFIRIEAVTENTVWQKTKEKKATSPDYCASLMRASLNYQRRKQYQKPTCNATTYMPATNVFDRLTYQWLQRQQKFSECCPKVVRTLSESCAKVARMLPLILKSHFYIFRLLIFHISGWMVKAIVAAGLRKKEIHHSHFSLWDDERL